MSSGRIDLLVLFLPSSSAVQCSAVQYSTVQYRIDCKVQCSIVQYSTVQTMKYSTVQCSAVHRMSFDYPRTGFHSTVFEVKGGVEKLRICFSRSGSVGEVVNILSCVCAGDLISHAMTPLLLLSPPQEHEYQHNSPHMKSTTWYAVISCLLPVYCTKYCFNCFLTLKRWGGVFLSYISGRQI
jgi:hypothetical protein